MEHRRWYDKDPVLKEALDLLKLATDGTKDEACEFIEKLQEEVAGDVLDKVHDIMAEYHGKGRRWYDNDPVILKALALLKVAPKKTQKEAALKLLLALERKSFENFEINNSDK